MCLRPFYVSPAPNEAQPGSWGGRRPFVSCPPLGDQLSLELHSHCIRITPSRDFPGRASAPPKSTARIALGHHGWHVRGCGYDEEMEDEGRPQVKRVRLTGARFEGGRLPVDSLVELQKYQDIVRIAAEAEWKQVHPGEQLPDDFPQFR